MVRINKNKKIKLIKFNKNFITSKYIRWLNNKNLMQYSDRRHQKHNKKSCRNYLESFKMRIAPRITKANTIPPINRSGHLLFRK